MLKALLTAYLLSTALLPFLHHDFVCHVKSSTHCTSCIAASSGEPSANIAGIDGSMVDAGFVPAPDALPSQGASLHLSPGRSPPVFQS
jgi:hypothetical protein